MGLVIVFIVITAMLAANAFYVAAEFAAVSASKPKLSSKAKDGRREADYIEKTVTDEYRMDRYIACAQVGITLTSLVIGFYGQRALAPYLTPLLDGVLPAGIVATAVVAPLLLVVLTMLQVILGELFPKSIALRNPETVAFKTARPMRWSLLVLGPFISLLNGSAIWIMRRFGLDKPKESGEEHSHEELRAVISESLEGGVIGRSAHEMLRQVLAFEERTVAGVMQPRSQIVALAPETAAADALPTMVDAPFTRFPLFRTDDIDQPAGFVHLRDVHAADGTTPLSDIAREIDLVPDTLTLAETWARLTANEIPIALVFNEYGIVSGLISVEDLVEEIIGEVVDEFDDEEPRIRQRRGHTILRGDLLVAEVNHKFELELPEDDADTISGLIATRLGVDAARRGSEIDVAGTSFTVESTEKGMPRLISFVPEASK